MPSVPSIQSWKFWAQGFFFASLRIHFPKGISYWKVGPDVRIAGSFHWRVNSRVIDIGKELRDHQSRIFTFRMRGTWDFKSNQEAVKSYLIADDLESRELCELVSHLANGTGRDGKECHEVCSSILSLVLFWSQLHTGQHFKGFVSEACTMQPLPSQKSWSWKI